MKKAGSIIAVLGFALWFGGGIIVNPNIAAGIGLPLFIIGAVLYFVGIKRLKTK